jgi:hypothetical protein
MPNRFFISLSLLVSLSACHSTSGRTEPEPVISETPPSRVPASVPLSSRTSWVLQPDSELHRYSSTTSSTVESAEPGSPIRDSTTLLIDFSLTLSRRHHGAAYSAVLERLSIYGGNRISPEAGEYHLPFSFTGRVESGQLVLDPINGQVSSAPDCSTQISSAFPAISRAILVLPLQLQKDLTWTDSASTSICSGSLPVILTTVRSYRVIGETETGTKPVVLLVRQDKTFSNGEGTNGQHRIQLRTEGSGQTQLLVATRTGSLIEATGTNTTTLTVTTSGRTQKFVQISREHVIER